jgi:hypothetical protein
MSRVAPPHEKVLAIGRTFTAIRGELEGYVQDNDPRVQAALIDAATRVAMATDTRDIGILGTNEAPLNQAPIPAMDAIRLWRDYWVGEEGTNRDWARTDEAVRLMVRQFTAILPGEED